MKTHKETIYTELLVLRCRRGDKDAFKELITTYELRIFYYLQRLVSNEEDAWDILQETWMKVYRGIGKLREPKRLQTWLYRIARNTAVSHVRRESTRKEPFNYQTTDNNNNEIAIPNNESFIINYNTQNSN